MGYFNIFLCIGLNFPACPVPPRTKQDARPTILHSCHATHVADIPHSATMTYYTRIMTSSAHTHAHTHIHTHTHTHACAMLGAPVV